jgi:hypothetical protein
MNRSAKRRQLEKRRRRLSRRMDSWSFRSAPTRRSRYSGSDRRVLLAPAMRVLARGSRVSLRVLGRNDYSGCLPFGLRRWDAATSSTT